MPLITTTYGPREESTLDKREGTIDNDNEHTTWVEYRIGEEVVHRSAHVRLKVGVFGDSAIGSF